MYGIVTYMWPLRSVKANNCLLGNLQKMTNILKIKLPYCKPEVSQFYTIDLSQIG